MDMEYFADIYYTARSEHYIGCAVGFDSILSLKDTAKHLKKQNQNG